MKGLATAYSLECKKIFSARAFWIFAVIILLLCILITASFRTIENLIEGMDESAVGGSGYGASAAELAEIYRAQLDEYLAQVADGTIERKPSDTTETYLKNMIAICEYCDEHGLDISKLNTFGSIGSLKMSPDDYASMMMQIIFGFSTIMSIVLAARVVAGETEDGTMRMQLTRPIKRSTLLTAKHGAVFTASMTLGIVLTVVFMIVGALFFDGASRDVVLVDAYQNVAVINPYAAIFILLLFFAATTELTVQFTIFCGSLTGGTGALVIPLVLYLFADTVAAFLYDTYIPFVGLFTNMGWAGALTPQGAPINGMSIYSMLAVTAVWFAVMTAVNYISFEKRDLK